MIFNCYYILLLFIIVSCVFTILSTNPVRSILFLILTFTNSSFLLILLGLDFLGLSLIVIYVGAVAILFLFIIMLINIKEVEFSENIIKYIPLGCLLIYNIYLNQAFDSSFTNTLKTSNLWVHDWSVLSNPIIIKKIGLFLYTENFISFLLIGIVLLISILIVIFLGNLKTKVKNQDLFNQIQF